MKKLALAVAAAFAATAYTGAAFPQEKTVRITGFGAKSGVVRSFGINSEAAMLAAADMINKQGGVKLADGSKAKIVVDFFDDRCTAEEGISVLRRIYGTDALVAVGPTSRCSGTSAGSTGTPDSPASPTPLRCRRPQGTCRGGDRPRLSAGP